jgi:hypothetical protein
VKAALFHAPLESANEDCERKRMTKKKKKSIVIIMK